MIAEMKTYVPGKKDVCGPKLDKEYVIKLDSGMLDEHGVVCVHGIFTGEKLVRCKDCKYWTDVRGGVCKRLAIYAVEDWFCGNAEKRSAQEAANRKKNKASNGT